MFDLYIDIFIMKNIIQGIDLKNVYLRIMLQNSLYHQGYVK